MRDNVAICRLVGRRRRAVMRGATRRPCSSGWPFQRGAALPGHAQRRPASARRGRARNRSTSPSIVLADEPTGALDSINGAAVLALLDQLNRQGRRSCSSRTTRTSRTASPIASSSSSTGGSLTTIRSAGPPDGRDAFTRPRPRSAAAAFRGRSSPSSWRSPRSPPRSRSTSSSARRRPLTRPSTRQMARTW